VGTILPEDLKGESQRNGEMLNVGQSRVKGPRREIKTRRDLCPRKASNKGARSGGRNHEKPRGGADSFI